MKKILLLIIIILELSLIKIPPYVELNNLAIIEEIAVKENKDTYTLTLKEIIPVKADQGIDYKYKYYEETASTIKKAYQKLEKETKKKLYLAKVKSLITNMIVSNSVITELDINPSTIIHTNNVSSKLT